MNDETGDLEQRLSDALERMRTSFAAARRAADEAEARATALEAERDALKAAQAALEQARAELENEREVLSAELAARSAGAAPEGSADQSGEITKLTEALETERARAAALSDQISAHRAGDTLELTRLRGEVEEMQARLSETEAAMSQLRRVNAQLRQNNKALRQAHQAALPDADLVNEGLAAELEALQATRSADRAELDSILAALKPLIGENAHA